MSVATYKIWKQNYHGFIISFKTIRYLKIAMLTLDMYCGLHFQFRRVHYITSEISVYWYIPRYTYNGMTSSCARTGQHCA
jgi:hypothetical protein